MMEVVAELRSSLNAASVVPICRGNARSSPARSRTLAAPDRGSGGRGPGPERQATTLQRDRAHLRRELQS